jgi:DNA-binding IclR family transcriptional regulator
MQEVVKSSLKEPAHELLFELTGKLPVTELSKKTGFSAGKISNIWQSWERAGMLVKDGKQYRRLF